MESGVKGRYSKHVSKGCNIKKLCCLTLWDNRSQPTKLPGHSQMICQAWDSTFLNKALNLRIYRVPAKDPGSNNWYLSFSALFWRMSRQWWRVSFAGNFSSGRFKQTFMLTWRTKPACPPPSLQKKRTSSSWRLDSRFRQSQRRWLPSPAPPGRQAGNSCVSTTRGLVTRLEGAVPLAAICQETSEVVVTYGDGRQTLLHHRGERLIEPSSSWFQPSFPSG